VTRSGPVSEIRWDEVEHFAGFGWDLDRIAERLGVDGGSLRTALHRKAARQAGKDARTGEAA
jgi:hypothetical protein